MKKFYAMMTLAVLMSFNSQAQRYLEEIFTEVDVISDVVYGTNASVLTYQMFGEAIPIELKMDVYQPVNDTETNRPVILYFHTGNFLPYPVNGGTGGVKTDSTAVEICSRMARMGYVAISCDYRLGWNPLAPTQPERTNSLINAAYRGVQDCRTAVRYLRKTVAEENNSLGIDAEKICVWGQGTGGYIAFAASTLDNWLEDIASLPKFNWDPAGTGTPIPMVVESVNGNADGTTYGIYAGDTLCYINHIEYASDFDVMVNMGGAMGDLSWLEDTSTPMVSFHVPTDPFAPYAEGTVIVPTTDEQVVDVSGSYSVQQAAAAFTNNAIFAAADTYLPGINYTIQANLNNNGYTGLYPFIRSGANIYDSAPWEWWDPSLIAEENSNNGLLTNPDMSAAKAKLFIDSIQGYAAPRIMCALNLPGSPCEVITAANDECAGAFDLSNLTGGPINQVVASTPFSNEDATGETTLDGADGCWADGIAADGTTYTADATVWFSFEGDGNEYIIYADDCAGQSTFLTDDTQMVLYSGTGCGDLTVVACNDDIDLAGGIYWAGVDVVSSPNTNYYLVVDGFNYTDFQAPGVYGIGDFCLNFVNFVVSVDEKTATQFAMFPNPAKDIVTIRANADIKQINVYNMVGGLVYTQLYNNASSVSLDAGLAQGVYMVEVMTAFGPTTQKLIVE
jgi:Secretion system C-terminal sorting domain/alpha/beta hydrolase fold